MKLKKIGLQGFGLTCKKGLLAISFLIIARTLGPRDFGDFSYTYTLVYMFALLSSLGFSPVSTREVARSSVLAPSILNASLFTRASSTAVSMVALLFVAAIWNLGHAGIRTLIMISTLGIPPMAFADQLGAYVMGFGRNLHFAVINLIQWGLYFVGTAMALAFWPKLEYVIVSQVGALWLSVAVCAWFFRFDLRNALSKSVDWGLIRFLVIQAAPLAVSSMLGMLYFRIGTLQLYRLRGAADTGLYTSALQIIEALQLVPMAILGAMFPYICQASEKRSELSQLFRNIVAMLLFGSLFIGATGSVLSSEIVKLLFGTKFLPGGRLLAALIWAAVPTFLHFAFANFLIAINKQNLIAISAAVGTVVSIVSNVILIHRYGALGAVYGSILTEAAICVFHFYFVSKAVDMRKMAVPILASVIGASAVLLVGLPYATIINSKTANTIGFGVLSTTIFTLSFIFYRRLRLGQHAV